MGNTLNHRSYIWVENYSASYLSKLSTQHTASFYTSKLSLIIERNQPQQFDQGCSHLTLHVNVLIEKKVLFQFSDPSWPWRRKLRKTVCALWDSCHFAPGKVSWQNYAVSLGKEKIIKETYKVFHTRILFVRT